MPVLVSNLVGSGNYPNVQAFIIGLLDMQFADVRAMLQLPRPDIGITPACNFAITSTLCNLVSGISTTIYKPSKLLHEVRSNCGSGRAFKGLIADFFPYTPAGAKDFPGEFYQLCRNPLAHSVGVIGAATPVVAFTRIFDAAHPDRGWAEQELNDLEDPAKSFRLYRGIVIDAQRWTVHCDSLYLEIIETLCRVCSDSQQMQAAENRFAQGIHNWRT